MVKRRKEPNQTHVVKDANGWAIKRENAKRATKIVKTKKEAEKIAREISNNQETELIIHNMDGTISEKDSNGNDPRNIPG